MHSEVCPICGGSGKTHNYTFGTVDISYEICCNCGGIGTVEIKDADDVIFSERDIKCIIDDEQL